MKSYKKSYSTEIQKEIVERIEKFNQKNFRNNIDEISYSPEFKGKYLFLNRIEYGDISPVARLTYTGEINKWDFAIFKWSSEEYDPDEWFFPGAEFVDGTIEGAMKAGVEAYPLE